MIATIVGPALRLFSVPRCFWCVSCSRSDGDFCAPCRHKICEDPVLYWSPPYVWGRDLCWPSPPASPRVWITSQTCECPLWVP